MAGILYRSVIGVLIVAPWAVMGVHWQTEHRAHELTEATAAEAAPIAAGEVPESAEFGPVPGFVAALQLPTPDVYQHEPESGVRYLLRQIEHDARPAEPDYFFRLASEPVSTAGLDNVANVNITFDPAFQRLTFHSLQVIRDGEVQDRRDTTSIEFARRETRLERRMFDGRVTAIVRFDDIRLGDIVEYSYTISGRNPAVPDHDARTLWLGFAAPVEATLVRSHWPSDHPPSWQLTGPDFEADVIEVREGDSITLSVGPTDMPSFPGERNAPGWAKQAPVMRVANFEDWADVAAWSQDFYRPVASPEVLEIAARIRAEHSDTDEQVIAALRFVQDEVRYLATLFGAGGYVPQSPAATLERLYGDCKAKTLLLLSLLEALGVEAEAALVHTGNGRGLPDVLPSHIQFNHVIVRAHIDGRTVWLDGTESETGGQLDTLSQPDFGYALPISQDSTGLVAMTPVDPGETDYLVREQFDLTTGPQSATLAFTMVGQGDGANGLRAVLARSGRADLQQSFIDRYRSRYGSVTAISDLVVEDDRQANTLTYAMTLGLADPISEHEDGARNQLSGQATIRLPASQNAQRERRFPLKLNYPGSFRSEIEVMLPDNAGDWIIETPARQLDHDAFSFALETRREGDTVRIDYDMRVLQPYVSAEAAGEVLDLNEQIAQLSRWSLIEE
ncbi:DUF3857 domain-containing transglutaminase family protein [Maricaulis sp. CAU 1757]